MSFSGRNVLRTGRLMALIAAIGLVPLAVGIVVVRRSSTEHAKAELDQALTNEAASRASALENYFERARSVVLLTAHNPAFRDFYSLPGSRREKVLANGPVVRQVNAALDYLERLYPGSIGESCFIDRNGWENARIVRGERAPFADLGNELENPFVAPSFALKRGQVFHARPYVSPDTHEWVIANTTLVPTPGRAKRAIVHFEVTIESFRREAAASKRNIYIGDARTGAVVIDSRMPQRIGAPLGRKGDRRFASLTAAAPSGVVSLGDARFAYRRLATSVGNENRWFVVVESKPVAATTAFGGLPLLILALALGLIGFAIARRWVRLSADLDQRDAALAIGERRYRRLFEEAEGARVRLAEQNDQLRELDRLKDEFVALVSHELRTPLTSIRGYLELVLDGAGTTLSEEQEQFLRVVERNAQRLQRLVGDLLFIAQVDAGRLSLEVGAVDLAEVAIESVEAAGPLAADKEIELVVAGDHVVEVTGDRSRLAQLLDNLISNALKFTPAGGRIDVCVTATPAGGQIDVADTGMGISEAEQDRLFGRFFRTAAATEQAIPGTGLGLAISKAIAEAHGGTITVESEVGRGTTFRVFVGVPPDELEQAA
jgi:signal transduction histidine kinase